MIRGLSGKKLINQIARPLPCPLNREPRHKQAGGASFRSLGVWVSDFTWRSIIERALTATKEAQFVRQKEKEKEREREREREREYQTTAMEPVENRCFIRFGLSTSGKRRKTIIAFSRGLQRKYCHCRRGQSAVDGINLA